MKRTKVIAIVIAAALLLAVALAVGLYALNRRPSFEAVVLNVNEGSLSLYKADESSNDRLSSASISADRSHSST